MLFEQIKLYLDRERKKGQFFMCGSQQFKMIKGVSESLAGRIGLVTLLGFSMREEYGIECDAPFLPTEEYLSVRREQLADIAYDEVWREFTEAPCRSFTVIRILTGRCSTAHMCAPILTGTCGSYPKSEIP